jgi:hypothetical protein
MYWALFLGKNGCVMSKKYKILQALQSSQITERLIMWRMA